MIRFSALFVGLFCAVTLAVPPTPVADPSGVPKNRYLSMSVPTNGGEPTALRVTLVSLHHVSPPYIAEPTPPPFSSFEGEYRWVGPPVFATENDNDPTPFIAAPLQCTPYYHNWSTLGLFHVYGDAVIPSSAYEVVALDESCAGAEEGCVDISSALPISTSRFGDVTSPFNPPATNTRPDAADVASVVYKVLRAPLTQSKASVQLQPNIPDPTRTVNVWDCIMVANAFGGYGYPWGGPTSCGAPQNASSESATGNVAAALGDPTLKVFITPVPAQGTSSYPSGTQIVGQELIAPTGGFRALFNVQFQDWNPDNIVFLRGYQIQVDAEGMRGINANPPLPGVDLALPQEPCIGNNDCRTLYDENGARCNANQCAAAFISNPSLVPVGFPVHNDFVFSDAEVILFPTESSPTGPIIGCARGRFSNIVWDDGSRTYAGTLVLDIPAQAAGHVYTLNVREGSETMAVAGEGRDGEPPLVDVPIAQVTPAVIRVGVQSDATGINRSRFISFVPGHSGEQMAIRVKLVSLHHVDPPYTGGPSIPFSSFEGQYRWVGPPAQYVESTASAVPFYAASLQCDPHYQDWSSSGYLHVTGPAVMPSSQYEVQFVPASCMGNEDACAEISAPILRETTRWGDVETPFNPPMASAQPDLADVSSLVNKFRNAPGAPIKARALLAGSDASGNIDLTTDLSFIHISACVDAFRGAPYPHTGPQACP